MHFFARHHFLSAIFLLFCVTLLWSRPQRALAVTASIDHIRMTVYYTESAAAEVPVFSWASASGAAIAGYVWHRRKRFSHPS